MSDETNVQLVRDAFEAWNRRDLEAVLAVMSGSVEYVNPPNAVEPGVRRGIHELSEVMRRQWEILGPSARFEIERIEDRGGEVLVVTRALLNPLDSDLHIETQGVSRWSIEAGAVARVEILGAGPDYAKALRAAGLSE